MKRNIDLPRASVFCVSSHMTVVVMCQRIWRMPLFGDTFVPFPVDCCPCRTSCPILEVGFYPTGQPCWFSSFMIFVDSTPRDLPPGSLEKWRQNNFRIFVHVTSDLISLLSHAEPLEVFLTMSCFNKDPISFSISIWQTLTMSSIN